MLRQRYGRTKASGRLRLSAVLVRSQRSERLWSSVGLHEAVRRRKEQEMKVRLISVLVIVVPTLAAVGAMAGRWG